MKLRKLLTGAATFVAMLSVLVLAGSTSASALTASDANAKNMAAAVAKAKKLNFEHIQFSATGFPTFFDQDITNPPQIGQGFTLEEVVKDTSGNVIGTNHIECTIIGFTTSTLQFFCTGTFTFTNGGTLNIVTTFTFDPANLPAMYDAYVIGGTGAYAGAVGFIHVTDPGPGNPTGYVFDFYVF